MPRSPGQNRVTEGYVRRTPDHVVRATPKQQLGNGHIFDDRVQLPLMGRGRFPLVLRQQRQSPCQNGQAVTPGEPAHHVLVHGMHRTAVRRHNGGALPSSIGVVSASQLVHVGEALHAVSQTQRGERTERVEVAHEGAVLRAMQAAQRHDDEPLEELKGQPVFPVREAAGRNWG